MPALSEEEIVRLIDDAIKRHEMRVAIASGALGAAFLIGIFHAIFLLNNELHAWTIVKG